MSNPNTAKVNSGSSSNRRRTKKSQPLSLNKMATIDNPATQAEKLLNTDKGAQVIAMPVSTKAPENSQQVTLATSAITPLPGNRPIDSGNLEVLGTIDVMGERPIVAGSFKIWNTMTLSGERPISSSNLVISSTAMIMGNRPVASNYLDGNEDMMGYLD